MNKTGIDITSKRITDLEKETVKFALNLPKNSVCLDLGTGNGWLGIVLVFLHQKVYFIDKKINWKIRILKKLFKLKNMILIKKDINQMSYKDFPDNISLIYSGRFLHYLKYEEAKKLLKILKNKMNKNNNSKLFFSVSGNDSELAKNRSEKYDFLSKENQKKFQIKEKVFLYSKKELQNLFEKYFETKKIWQSDFGNVFIISSIKK
jgi:cyclopropane fatty-acyl-phospholipid synthase-like methyltransferase